MGKQQATFAAGCFWGVEAEFRKIEGVLDTEVGYTGGHAEDPSYEEVCSGNTGHAEAVRVEFDPEEVSYRELVDRFWQLHNPTTKNREGPDIGSQYRSAIYYHSPDQKETAVESRDDHQKTLSDKIVTELEPAGDFYRAEEYHQRYFEKQGRDVACASTVKN